MTVKWRLCTGPTICSGPCWFPLASTLWSAYNQMAEERLLPVIVVGVLLSVAVWVAAWGASLHGAWLLGRPDRRSAFLAWWRGLLQAFKSPLATFGTLALWGLPALLLSTLPLLVGVFVPGMRGGLMGSILVHVAAIAAAFCRVALFTSFAPVCGLLHGKDQETKFAKPVSSAVRRDRRPGPTYLD